MTSLINPAKPAGPIAYTADVRNNFAAAASEIAALQVASAAAASDIAALQDASQSLLPIGDVRRFGAVFDGLSHPLSSQFATLSAAQAVYPHAIALTDEIDGVAIQAAINACAARVTEHSYGGEVLLPAGLGLINQPLVINKPTISLRAPGGGFLFRSNVEWWIPSTATKLRWTGAARTPGQGQINMLTVEPTLAAGRLLAANNVSGVMFDCNFIAGCAGPVFRSIRESTIECATNEPRGIAYPNSLLSVGSTTITLSTTTGVRVGESIVSASLPEGAYVASIIDGVRLTASIQASASSTETATIGGEGIRFDVVPGFADSNDCRELTVHFHGMSQSGTANATAPLFMIGGSGTLGAGAGNLHYGNTCVSTFDVWVCNNHGPGLVINNSDHNLFPNVAGFHIGTGNGSAIVCNGSLDPNNGGGRFHRFGHIILDGTIKFTGTDTGGFSGGSTGNVIEFLDRQNNAAYPTVGAGASVRVGVDNYTPSLAALGASYAIVAHVPDNTVFGGNNRGVYAVDLQQFRTTAAQVAAGQQSVIIGGEENLITSTATDAVIMGGRRNGAFGVGSVVLGGVNNIATESYSVAGGFGASADVMGSFAFSSGTISPGRRAQTNIQILRGLSAANSLPVRLTADGLPAGSRNVVNLLSVSQQQCSAISVMLAAIGSDNPANSYAWRQPMGLLSMAGSPGSTIYLPIGMPISAGLGAGVGIVVSEAADTVNGGYNLTFTPPAGNADIWRVAATVEWTRIDGT